MKSLSASAGTSTSTLNGTTFNPIRMLTIDIGRPLPSIAALDPRSGRCYRQARLLIRLHTRLLGFVDVPLGDNGLRAEDCAAHIWQSLQHEINEHLVQQGMPEIQQLDRSGVPDAACLPWVQARANFRSQAPFASIVMCTRDRIDFLKIHLPHLLTLNYPDYEIIIVDNASSTSAVADLVQGYYGHLPRVRYVREERPGLSWARNCGLRHARGELIAFLDDDEVPDLDWLLELAYAFQTEEHVGCVTGGVIAAEIETPSQLWIEQFGGFYKGRGFRRALFNLTSHRIIHPLYPYLSSIFGAGANMAFRTAVLRELGGFDPALGAGTQASAAEEIEVFFRLIMRGYTLMYEPAALTHHFHRRTYTALQKQIHSYGRGFTAYLTKSILDDPQRLLYLVGQTPIAIDYLFSKESPRNENKALGYPIELTLRELLGMLYGPVAYMRSRQRVRQIVQQYGMLDVSV